MVLQPLTCDSSFMLPTCFPHSPPRFPIYIPQVDALIDGQMIVGVNFDAEMADSDETTAALLALLLPCWR